MRVLDLGCGGGLVAEEMARLGYCLTGIDPSERSIAVARAHAQTIGVAIDYRSGAGEALPFGAATFEAAYCLDVLEHVSAVEKVLSEIRRVLKPEGLFVFDTINRTWFSKLFSIKIMQNWQATSVLPPDFHVWDKFIKPTELKAMLVRQGLEPQEFVGLPARGNPLKHIRMLRKRTGRDLCRRARELPGGPPGVREEHVGDVCRFCAEGERLRLRRGRDTFRRAAGCRSPSS